MPRRLAERAPAVLEDPGGAQSWRFEGRSYPNVGLERRGRVVPARSGVWSRPGSTRCDRGASTSRPGWPTWTSPGSGPRCASPRWWPGSAEPCSRGPTTPSWAWPAPRAWNSVAPRGLGRNPSRADHPPPAPLAGRSRPGRRGGAGQCRPGLQGGQLPRVPGPARLPVHLHQPTGTAFFEACQDTDTVVCLHTGASSWAPLPSPDPPFELLPTVFPVNALIAAAEWVWSGVAVRFPGLAVALSEGGIGWVPMLMDRVDYVLDHSASGTESATWTSDLPTERGAGPQLLVLHHRRPLDHPGARPDRAGPRDGGERLPPCRLDVAGHPGRAGVHLRPSAAGRAGPTGRRQRRLAVPPPAAPGGGLANGPSTRRPEPVQPSGPPPTDHGTGGRVSAGPRVQRPTRRTPRRSAPSARRPAGRRRWPLHSRRTPRRCRRPAGPAPPPPRRGDGRPRRWSTPEAPGHRRCRAPRGARR